MNVTLYCICISDNQLNNCAYLAKFASVFADLPSIEKTSTYVVTWIIYVCFFEYIFDSGKKIRFIYLIFSRSNTQEIFDFID